MNDNDSDSVIASLPPTLVPSRPGSGADLVFSTARGMQVLIECKSFQGGANVRSAASNSVVRFSKQMERPSEHASCLLSLVDHRSTAFRVATLLAQPSVQQTAQIRCDHFASKTVLSERKFYFIQALGNAVYFNADDGFKDIELEGIVRIPERKASPTVKQGNANNPLVITFASVRNTVAFAVCCLLLIVLTLGVVFIPQFLNAVRTSSGAVHAPLTTGRVAPIKLDNEIGTSFVAGVMERAIETRMLANDLDVGDDRELRGLSTFVLTKRSGQTESFH